MAVDAALLSSPLSSSRKVSRKWPPSGCGFRWSRAITSAADSSGIAASRAVLALPDFRKNLPGRLSSQMERLGQLRKVGTQERVCCFLLRQGRGDRGLVLGSQSIDLARSLGQCRIVRFDGPGEADI